MKLLLGGLLLAAFLTGNGSSMEQAQFGHSFFQKIDQVTRAVDQENWPKAKQKSAELKKMYASKRWKVQFIGDEGEYEGVEMSLAKLTTAIKEKSKVDALIEASELRALIKAIYSF